MDGAETGGSSLRRDGATSDVPMETASGDLDDMSGTSSSQSNSNPPSPQREEDGEPPDAPSGCGAAVSFRMGCPGLAFTGRGILVGVWEVDGFDGTAIVRASPLNNLVRVSNSPTGAGLWSAGGGTTTLDFTLAGLASEVTFDINDAASFFVS